MLKLILSKYKCTQYRLNSMMQNVNESGLNEISSRLPVQE